MMSKKYLKVMFGNTSGADKNLKYKLNKVNVANNWNPTAKSGKDFGGFNYCAEDQVLRWLHRGDMVYDVLYEIKINKSRAKYNKETYEAINSANKNEKVFNSVDDLFNELNK